MKHKYFGDINDYRKYGLLRILSNNGALKSSICWMLTPDDGSNDGRHLDYLKQPEKWRAFDPVLFDFLHKNIEIKKIRDVNVLQRAGIVPAAHYYSRHLPDDAAGRKAYFSDYMGYSENVDLVFFDPDIGLELKLVKYGDKNSSKYIYWSELIDVYAMGSSVLIYQHFPREKRSIFINKKMKELAEKTGADRVFSFITPKVLFLLASQKRHRESFIHLSKKVSTVWGDQIICNLHETAVKPDQSNIQIKKATIKQKPVLEKLMQLYLHDFSEYDNHDLNLDGLYEYKYLELYWTEEDRHPFLIYHENQIAGFALINSHVILDENKGAKAIAEFFVMRKYRRKGIGSFVAASLFDMFPGKWEVSQEKENKISHEFWVKVISEYTEGKFSEIISNDDRIHGPVQSFDNS